MGSRMNKYAAGSWVMRTTRFAREIGHESRSVYIIDDHPLICEGMAAILHGDGYVIMGTQSRIRAALCDVLMIGADAVVLDIGGECEHRLAAIPTLVMQGKKVIVCSLHPDRARIRRAIQAGASAYVCKTDDVSHLLAALRVSLATDAVAPAESASVHAASPMTTTRPGRPGLSNRESKAALLTGALKQ